jgi:hypothetical protein
MSYTKGRCDRIRQELEHGPCTASELAALCGMSMRLASAHLTYLRSRGKVQVIGAIPTKTHKSNIYALVGVPRIVCTDDRCQRHAKRPQAIAEEL